LKLVSIGPSLHMLKFFFRRNGTALRNEYGDNVSKFNYTVI